MRKHADPRQLAVDLLPRSICAVKVAAVLADSFGVFSWAWNSMGRSGFGEHAEAAAIRRANKRRVKFSTIYIAARRGKAINARPCEQCMALLRGWGIRWVVYRSGLGWHTEVLR